MTYIRYDRHGHVSEWKAFEEIWGNTDAPAVTSAGIMYRLEQGPGETAPGDEQHNTGGEMTECEVIIPRTHRKVVI